MVRSMRNEVAGVEVLVLVGAVFHSAGLCRGGPFSDRISGAGPRLPEYNKRSMVRHVSICRAAVFVRLNYQSNVVGLVIKAASHYANIWM